MDIKQVEKFECADCEESKQHCQTCDEWVDKVKYNSEIDQDQCKHCFNKYE